ncbi:MAG: hypothetical protein ACREJV_06635 [Candidatus Rokuibacteriota bacterium]
MTKISAVIAAALVASLGLGGVAMAQGKPTDQPAASPSATPPKIEGRVTKIDRNSGMVTLQGPDGQTHEFRGNDETLKDLKVGDSLELTLRQPPR